MRKTICILLCLAALAATAQDYADTSFQVRGMTCTCKYNRNPADDLGVSLSGGHGTSSKAEQAAYYSSDKEEWNKFLKKNLDKGFKGKHEVEVRFRVEKNGDLTEFELLSKSPTQKFQEVVRVLKLSGKWYPAIRNGFCIGSTVREVFEL